MRTRNLRQKLLAATLGGVATVALAAGCSGGGGGDSATTTPTPTPTPCSTISPTLSALQTAVFTPTCALSSCHGGVQSPDLSAGNVLVSTSNVTATETFNGNSIKLIDPGSKATSYLYLKVTNANGITPAQMPQTGQALNQCQIDAIGQWIDGGALDN